MKNLTESSKKDWMFLKMRTISVIILACIALTAARAQDNLVSLSAKAVPVEEIINEIRKQTDANIIYNHEELKKCGKVSVEAKNITIEEALTRCFKNSPLTYKKVNNTYVITPKDETTIPELKQEMLTQSLRGRIIDRDLKITLPFANVVVLNTKPQLGATTDVDGNFTIDNLPVGRYSLQVSYVGYQEIIMPEILVGSGKQVVLTIELTEKSENLDEIVVNVRKGEASNEMATVSAKSFSVEETKRYAASFCDPARMALVYAGVSTNDDSSNEIIIRGNSPNWMLWKLEGVEIPSPNHFAEEGYTSGAVSILSSNMLGKSDFYTGAFPAEYGNALSGVFDLKLRNGNSEEREYSVQMGLLGAEASIEGPFKKGYNGSYLLNYRYSTFSILNNLNIQINENELPNYQDLSYKINLPTKKAGIFSLWGIGGNSDVLSEFLPDTAQNQKFEHGSSDYTTYGMYATGIKHTYFPSKKSYINTVFSHAKSYSSETFDTMGYTGDLSGKLFDDLQSSSIRLATTYNQKVSDILTFRTGAVISQLSYDYFSKDADSLNGWTTNVNSNGKTNEYQAFVQTKAKFSDRIFLTAGLHFNHFALNNNSSIEPRAGLEVKLNHDQKIGLGFGIHSKHANLPVYFVEFEDNQGNASYLNKSLDLTKSTHYIASYEKVFFASLALKTEAYYQSISKLPVPNNPDKIYTTAFGGFHPDDTLASIGTGRNYGIELTIQKYFTNNYYFLISSSLYQSEYKAADNVWRNTKYNSNYATNFVGGKEIYFGENKMLSLNGKVVWTGGKRILPIDLNSSIETGYAVYDTERMYEEKAKDYFRIDLGARLHFFKSKVEHIIMLDIQNVTNHLNTWAQIYDIDNKKVIDYPMAGLIPILSYRVEF